MVLTDDIHLPDEKELNHKEIPVNGYILKASAMHLGKYCDNQSKEFMLCRKEERDPRKCLKYGHDVTECGMDFYKKVKKSCKGELEWYSSCLEFTHGEASYIKCRNEQAIYDTCMEQAGFERAPFGHFLRLRVHESERPKPKPFVPIFPDAVEGFDFENKGKDVPEVSAGGKRPLLWLWSIIPGM